MMMGGLEGSALTAIGSAAVAFVTAAMTYSWKARGLFADLDKKIGDSKDTILRDFGEGLTALRTKVNSMELDTERHFVRREDFQNAVDSFTRSIDNLRNDLKGERAELKEEYASLRALLTEFILKANTHQR